MHNSVSQLTSLSACSRRQRKRKLAKPQKRQQHIDSREDEQKTLSGVCENTCSLRHNIHQNQHVDSIDVVMYETTDKSRETTEPRYVESERVTDGNENRIDIIKKEPSHEFIVDQWYDLGPCPHKYAYSPGPPEPIRTEKMEMKDNTADSATENSWYNETADNFKPKLASRTCKGVPSSHTFDPVKGMQVSVSTQVYPSPNGEGISGSTEVAQRKEPYKVNDTACPNVIPPMSILQPFLGCPLPTTGNSFILQQNHFPLSVHADTAYYHMAETANPSAVTSMTPRLNYSYMTNLSMAKPDVIHPHIRPEAGVSNLNHCSQNYSVYGKTDQLMTTTPTVSCPLSLSPVLPNPASFYRPEVSGHFFAPRYGRYQGSIECRRFLYPNNLYQSNSFRSPGVVLVPSHPYYVEQVPFVPLIPEVSYNHLRVDVPRCSADTGTHSTLPILQPAGRNMKTLTGNSGTSLLGTSNPMTTSAPLRESDKPGSTRETRATDPGPTSQHPARVKVKPRIATSTDFIDPTRIKFGADDVDTDDDLSKVNNFSDCSDQEWQPSNRDFKGSYKRERETGNGWSPKNDGFTELHSSVKKTRCRRRQRSSKELAECNECGKVFKGSYYLRRHQMSHSDVRPFQCITCNKCFKQKAHLIGHQSVHERALKLHAPDEKPPSPKSKSLGLGSKCPGRPKKAYTEKDRACRECGKIFKTVYRLKRHELSHTDVRPFSCRICGKAFKQTGHRNEHEANHENTKRRFLCNMCGVVFRCRSSFNNHMRSHGLEKLRLQTAKSDMGATHGDIKQEAGEICHTGYDCPYCTEKFATAQALNNHLETHVEVQQRRHVQPYSCGICRRAFTYRHNLIKHKLIHNAPDKFAQFYKEKFEAHVASGKPSFNCTKCPKVFIRKETLAKHCKIHTGSKPYKCAICSHEFTQNVHLKVHMRKHTGSRPFQCKECNRSFIDSTALAKHIEYEACNTDNSLYHCKLCDKMHYYLGSLKKHIRKRHGANEEDVEKYIIKSERSSKRRGACEGEAHPCQVCSSSFSEKCNLVRHIKRKHAILVALLQKELEGKRSLSNGVDECTASSAVNKDGDLNSDGKLAVAARRPSLMCYRPGSHVAASREAGVKSRGVASSGQPLVENHSCEEFNIPDIAASNQSNVEKHSCEEFNIPDVAASSQPKAERKLSITVAEAHAVPPPVLRSTAKTEPVNNSNLSAEKHEAICFFKHNREENTDEFLKGFQNSEFGFSEKQWGEMCAQKQFLCSNSCCSYVQAKSTESASGQTGEFITSTNKCTSEEASTSPTDFHFLYKIGLVVSSKGKVPGGPEVKQSCETIEKEFKCNPFIPVCKSLTRLSNSSSDNPKPHSHIYREEYHNQTPQLPCCRSRSLSFLDDVYNDRGEAVTSTDDSCSLGFSNEYKQGLNLSSSGSSCDEMITSREIYNIKHNLQVSETMGSVTKHLGSEMVHHSTEIEHHSTEIEHHSREIEHHSTEIEHHSTEIEHHSSEIEHHSSEIEHHSTEIEHHSTEIEHHSTEIEHHSSEIEHHSSEIEHHSTEIEHHSTEVEHHSSEIEHHSSEIENYHSDVKYSNEIKSNPGEVKHHSSEAEYPLIDVKHRSVEVKGHSSEVGHSHNEADYRDSEVEHPKEIEHPPIRIEHHSTQVEHRSHLSHHCSGLEHCSQLKQHPGEVEQHVSEKHLSPSACEPNLQNTFNSYALESDKRFMLPSTSECDNQIRTDTGNSKLGVKYIAALRPPDIGETAGLVANRSNWEPQVNKSLGTVGINASNFCASSQHITNMASVILSSTSHQQGKGDGQQLLDLRHCATPGEGDSASSRISVLLQRNYERGQMCIISPNLGLKKTSPRTGLSVLTGVEAMTSELGKCCPSATSTPRPYLSLLDGTVETSPDNTTFDDQMIKQGDVVSQQRKSVDTCSLIQKAAKDKSLDSSEYLPFEDVSNSVDHHVLSKSSRNFSSHMSAVNSFQNDYEACPTEAHIQYLGLLACKDAQEVKNRNIPIEDLYQKYKPWLEELIRCTRPRKRRIIVKLGCMKNTASAATVAEQLTYMRRTSFESTENRTQLRNTSECGTASSSMEDVNVEQTAASDPSVVTRRWPFVDKSIEEIQTDPDESLQTLAESGSQDSEVVLTSGHTSRSISPTVQQLGFKSSALPTSAAVDTHDEDLPCKMSATAAVSTRGRESVSGCVDSSSPQSTPDSTAKGRQGYVCMVCNKYFTARHQLKRHSMTHTDHRPFTCDKCGRAFRQKVHLSDHTKRHQGQRPFVCAGCGKRFVLKNEMNQHIKNHCRGSLDVFRGVSMVSDQRMFQVATTDCNPLPGAEEVSTQPTQQSQDCMLMIGQCYRAGDIISNGTITLKVIESAYNQPHPTAHSISITPPLEATVCSQKNDFCSPRDQCHSDPADPKDNLNQ